MIGRNVNLFSGSIKWHLLKCKTIDVVFWLHKTLKCTELAVNLRTYCGYL